MPIYEFYCPDCHTVYSFFSKTVNTQKTPPCPGCKKSSLQRRISRFSVVSGGSEEAANGLDNLPIDESRMESAMASLASEAEGIGEDDPKAAARLMRKFSDMTGLKYTGGMEDALSRLEAGEDPEALESEMGGMLDNEEVPFILPGKGGGQKSAPPKRDETLYEM